MHSQENVPNFKINENDFENVIAAKSYIPIDFIKVHLKSSMYMLCQNVCTRVVTKSTSAKHLSSLRKVVLIKL